MLFVNTSSQHQRLKVHHETVYFGAPVFSTMQNKTGSEYRYGGRTFLRRLKTPTVVKSFGSVALTFFSVIKVGTHLNYSVRNF